VVHETVRIRHELRRRTLVVRGTDWITPRMLRLRLGGGELSGFTSLSPDDHIKIFVTGSNGEAARRDYTPRRFDANLQELIVDFAMHEAGPVTAWARQARVGDDVEIGGPRGSVVVPDDFDWWLLIGDETALPAIGRRIEEFAPDTPVISVVAVTGEQEQQMFATAAQHRDIWVHRAADHATDATSIIDALSTIKLPSGDGFVWIAAEAGVARAVRKHVVDVMGHNPGWLKASGYWVSGEADASTKSVE
jgi:NADPH-dependent ferric siderophore reductase